MIEMTTLGVDLLNISKRRCNILGQTYQLMKLSLIYIAIKVMPDDWCKKQKSKSIMNESSVQTNAN